MVFHTHNADNQRRALTPRLLLHAGPTSSLDCRCAGQSNTPTRLRSRRRCFEGNIRHPLLVSCYRTVNSCSPGIAGVLDNFVQRQTREAEADAIEAATAQWLQLLPALVQACTQLPYPSALLHDLFQVTQHAPVW